MKKSIYVFGTIIYLEFNDSKEKEIMDIIISKLNELDDEMSIYKSGSVISKINELAGIGYVKVSDDFFYIIEKSIQYSILTNGILDVTCKPVTEKIKSGVTDLKIIKEQMKYINYKNILMNKSKKELMLKEKGMGLDLGAIVKGYATDFINNVLEQYYVNNAIIDLGGNIYVKGLNNDNSLWNVGIQDPLDETFNSAIYIRLTNKSIVTSGNYERGKHIISPKKGLIKNNDVLSLTIIADKSIDAECLSTPCFLMGVKKGMKFLSEKFDNIEYIYLSSDKKIHASNGIKEKIFIINNSYKIV